MWVKLEDKQQKGRDGGGGGRMGRSLIYSWVQTGASPPTYRSSAPRLSNCPQPPPAHRETVDHLSILPIFHGKNTLLLLTQERINKKTACQGYEVMFSVSSVCKLAKISQTSACRFYWNLRGNYRSKHHPTWLSKCIPHINNKHITPVWTHLNLVFNCGSLLQLLGLMSLHIHKVPKIIVWHYVFFFAVIRRGFLESHFSPPVLRCFYALHNLKA